MEGEKYKGRKGYFGLQPRTRIYLGLVGMVWAGLGLWFDKYYWHPITKEELSISKEKRVS